MYTDVLNDPDKTLSASLEQWHAWRDELEAATSLKPPGKYASLSEETKELAEQAAENMRAVEAKMGE